MLPHIRTLLRIGFRIGVCLLLGWLMASVIIVVGIVVAVVWFGDFDRALTELPKTKAFSPALMGLITSYLAGGIGALIGGLTCLRKVGRTFLTSLYGDVIPGSFISAFLGASVGILIGTVLLTEIGTDRHQSSNSDAFFSAVFLLAALCGAVGQLMISAVRLIVSRCS